MNHKFFGGWVSAIYLSVVIDFTTYFGVVNFSDWIWFTVYASVGVVARNEAGVLTCPRDRRSHRRRVIATL